MGLPHKEPIRLVLFQMQQGNQSNDTSSDVLRQEKARALALRSRPSSAARGLAQRKTRGPPRRPTTTPSLRPVHDRKAGIEAAHLQLQHGAAYFKATRRATTPRAECKRRRHTAAQSTGAFPARHKTASRGAHNRRKQPALQASATPTALAAAKLVIKLCAMSGWLTSFCRITAQRNKGPEVAVALKGKQRSAAPPAS